MARRTQHEWYSIQRHAFRRRDQRPPGGKQLLQRRLRIEPLEDRRLMAVVTVNTLDDTVDFNDGVTSLREAIFATNLVGGPDTIEFDASLTNGGPATLTLTQGQLPITDALSIIGPGADLLTIDASGNDPTPESTFGDDEFNDGDGSRVFDIDDGNSGHLLDVSIRGLMLTGGDVLGDGGAIRSAENLSVFNSTISGNSAFGSGGGIYSDSGNVTIIASTISENSVFFNGNGGGIFSNSQSGVGGHVTVTDSTIRGNSASDGGGIFSGNVAFTATGSTISDNSAAGSGGGIFSSTGNITTIDSTVSGNSAGHGGGGILSRYGLVSVKQSTVSDNSADGGASESGGGGISNYHGDLIVDHSTISGNVASVNGGGIYSRTGDVSIIDSLVGGNSSDHVTRRYGSQGGGGIFDRFGHVTVTRSTIGGNRSILSDGGGIASPDGQVTITDSMISGNSAAGIGGGIAHRYNGNVTINRSTIDYNFATDGGGIWGGKVTVTGSTISNNRATNDGGGILSRFGGVTMSNSTVSGNTARRNGGGLYVSNAASAIRHSTVTKNSALNGGGGAFIFGGSLALDHTILAANSTFGIGPDLTGLIGTTFDVRFSLIGNNAGSGLAATPNRTPDAKGNLIGPALLPEALVVQIDMAAMGDFEAGPDGDDFLFEYSLDGGAYQPLFASTVDDANSQTYYMERGTRVDREDPLSVNGVVLNNRFQSLTTAIPGGASQIRIRFTAANDGPSEAFAWRNLFIYGQNSGIDVGAAAQYSQTDDRFTAFAADADYTISGDMFGVRSRLIRGIPNLPSDVVDDSNLSPGDVQGIIPQFDLGRFFGVVDTVNGVGSNTNTATWTFNNKLVPIDPKLGPLEDNGGPTLTHALLAGSPALNMGDPGAVAGVGTVPTFDQRGTPFGRVFGGRIDIGAVEQQSVNWVVDTLADESDGNFGPGDLSFREAIGLARGSFGPATITFAPALTASGPATIHLTGGEIAIRDAVTIVGPGQHLLTIDAATNDPTPNENNGDGSRIFNVNDGDYATAIDVSISGVTLTGGDVSNWGGAILSFENTTVTLSTISGNSAVNDGGGIARYGTATPTFGSLMIVSSTISGNSAGGSGGGVFSSGVANTTVTDSTISGNSARLNGGGIFSNSPSGDGGQLTVTGSTISDNSANSSGGGIFKGLFDNLTLISSTITSNEALGGQGSGVTSVGNASTRTEVRSSIIAGNVHSDVDFDGVPTNSFQSNGYNLIGTGNATGEFVESGDQTGVVDALLGPLAKNGGPTLTHALLPGSPAIDAGDPSAVAGVGGVPLYDQRGNPFARIAGKAIDIGAIESLPTPPLLGDYNQDAIVDAADFTVWRNSINSHVAVYSGADGNGNGVIDSADCEVWKAHFGERLPSLNVGVASTTDRVAALAPIDSPPVSAENGTPARTTRGPALALSDTVYATFGHRRADRSTVGQALRHYAAVDIAVTDSLLLTRRPTVKSATGDDQSVDTPPRETEGPNHGPQSITLLRDPALSVHSVRRRPN